MHGFPTDIQLPVTLLFRKGLCTCLHLLRGLWLRDAKKVSFVYFDYTDSPQITLLGLVQLMATKRGSRHSLNLAKERCLTSIYELKMINL